MSKYKKKKAVMIDLNGRKNIKIIEAEKGIISDEEIKVFEDKLKSLSEQAEEFNKYLIEQELEAKPKISDEEFSAIMKNLFKQHKILKSMINEQKDI